MCLSFFGNGCFTIVTCCPNTPSQSPLQEEDVGKAISSLTYWNMGKPNSIYAVNGKPPAPQYCGGENEKIITNSLSTKNRFESPCFIANR